MTKKEYLKQYKEIHKEEIKIQRQEYYLKNRDKIKERMRKNYKLHRKEKLIYYKKYSISHKKEINRRHQNRIRNNIGLRILSSLRSRLTIALKNNSKSKHTTKLIGCNIKFLKKYLQKQFKSDMTWNNYGIHGWHIDHIRPCASFDLSKPSEQKKCFHYTNLQPLWAKENLSKGRN